MLLDGVLGCNSWSKSIHIGIHISLFPKSKQSQNFVLLAKNPPRDNSFKISACLRGDGYPHVPMVKRSQYIRIKNPLHKHFAGMPMVGGRGQKS